MDVIFCDFFSSLSTYKKLIPPPAFILSMPHDRLGIPLAHCRGRFIGWDFKPLPEGFVAPARMGLIELAERVKGQVAG